MNEDICKRKRENLAAVYILHAVFVTNADLTLWTDAMRVFRWDLARVLYIFDCARWAWTNMVDCLLSDLIAIIS